MHLLTSSWTKFTGYSNGDAIWPVPWSWFNTDPWIRGPWLLRRGLWALCSWLLPHTLCWLRPNVCQPGMKINCWKNALKLNYCWFLQEYMIFFIWSSFIISIQQIMIYITLGAIKLHLHKSYENDNFTFSKNMRESNNNRYQRTAKWYHGLRWCIQCLWIRGWHFNVTKVSAMRKKTTRSKLRELHLTNIHIKLKESDWWADED